jgi:predicted homoserine dehydrogenase-like protein
MGHVERGLAGLAAELARREAEGRPVRVGLVGAGKFGTMFLAQALRTPGLHVLGVCDRSVSRARDSLRRAGWPEERFSARTPGEALCNGSTWVTDDPQALVRADGLEVLVEATGSPHAAVAHARAALDCGRHVVMVTVEADVLVGPLLAQTARERGLVYTLAYGDQPALICELVDWARVCGFEVVCAGKGTRYLPCDHFVTPDEVWEPYGFTPEMVAAGDYNPRMFTSFLDGTKSAVEMAAVANATGLVPQRGGLRFPPCGVDELAEVCRPEADGGLLEHAGTVEVVSSLRRDGSPVPRDLRWGVFVVVRAPCEYVARCFREYGIRTDSSGRYAALYRPTHWVGLEVGVSVARAALRGEATGQPAARVAEVVATAKRDLRPGEVLDGEGGYRVFGKLLPAAEADSLDALPVGLAHGVRLRSPVARGSVVRLADVELDPSGELVGLWQRVRQGPSA